MITNNQLHDNVFLKQKHIKIYLQVVVVSTEVGGHPVLVQHRHEALVQFDGWAVLPRTHDRVVTGHDQIVSPVWSKFDLKKSTGSWDAKSKTQIDLTL